MYFKRVFSTRINAQRLSVIAPPTRRVFSFVRLAVDPKKPVLGRPVTTLWFAFKYVYGGSKSSPCRCTPLHLGADSEKFSFCIKIHLWTSNGSVDTKTVLRTVLTVVALDLTHKPKPYAESKIAWFFWIYSQSDEGKNASCWRAHV